MLHPSLLRRSTSDVPLEKEGLFMSAAEPIRDKRKLAQFASYYKSKRQYRNYALIVVGAHTAFRISDLLSLKWSDVYDEKSQSFSSHIELVEKKTGKVKTIALNAQVKSALRLLLPLRRGEFIFANNRKDARPISRIQAWRIIRAAASAVGLGGRIACHSLRKTFGYFAWKAGALPVLLMEIFNHTSFETTRRYLGITQDDLDEVYLGMELF